MDDEDSSESVLAERYELGALLGQGGMGAVRDATDRRLARRVAVKILRADLAEQPRARRRFETEAHAAARLAHPNVVTVFDSGEQDGVPFLVMERLPGRTLADELAAGRPAVERVRTVATEILSALTAAHAAGILHRDIKPANVLLTEDGHVKVSDFGIAKTIDDADQTQTVELVATAGYLAPERLAGEPATQRSDLYSVGVLLYEALSGQRPFAGDTPIAVIRAIEGGQAEPLDSLRPALPADLVAVVERAMARDPGQRFDSARDMAAALEPGPDPGATVPVDAPTVPDTVPVDLHARDGNTEVLQVPSSPPVAPLSRSPGPRRLVGLGVAAVVGATLVAGAVYSRRDGTVRTTRVSPTTASTVAVTPTTTRLPAPLADAIHGLEQAVER